MGIVVILTAANMGPHATERDFDRWHTFVCAHIDDAIGFEVHDVDMFDFANGPGADAIRGADDEQREAIRRWLGAEGWEAFCAMPECLAAAGTSDLPCDVPATERRVVEGVEVSLCSWHAAEYDRGVR